MYDSIGLQLGTSLQSAKLQLANLLQNCYFCFIQKTIPNSILWSLVIKYFLARLFCAPLPAAPGGNCPPLPPLCYATVTTYKCMSQKLNKSIFQLSLVVKSCIFVASEVIRSLLNSCCVDLFVVRRAWNCADRGDQHWLEVHSRWSRTVSSSV